MSIANLESVFIALGTQQVMQMCLIVICDLYCSSMFLHIILQTVRFSKKKKKILNKRYVLIFFTTFGRKISHSKKNGARYDQKCVSVFM